MNVVLRSVSPAGHLPWVLALCGVAVILIWIAVRAIRWAKKGTKAGMMLAAVAYPFPDQPPPHEQLEQANRLDKDAEAGRLKD